MDENGHNNSHRHTLKLTQTTHLPQRHQRLSNYSTPPRASSSSSSSSSSSLSILSELFYLATWKDYTYKLNCEQLTETIEYSTVNIYL